MLSAFAKVEKGAGELIGREIKTDLKGSRIVW